MLVESSLGYPILSNRMYHYCLFVIQYLVFPTNLIEMLLKDFNVINGMECLYKYHSVIECTSKHVTSKDYSCLDIIIRGERSLTCIIISVLLERMFMRQCCGAYLAHIVDTQLEGPCIKGIAAVCDFLEFFPKNIPRLPLEREV